MMFGRNMIEIDGIDGNAPRDPDAWYLAMVGAALPSSFLPFGNEQVIRCADPYFRLVSGKERPG
jgi:cyclopropane-fatty-acyl-phospholipid synthase